MRKTVFSLAFISIDTIIGTHNMSHSPCVTKSMGNVTKASISIKLKSRNHIRHACLMFIFKEKFPIFFFQKVNCDIDIGDR